METGNIKRTQYPSF